MCVLILSTMLSEKFLILRRILRDIAISVRKYSCQVTTFLVGFYLHFNFLGRFSKNTQISNCMKICPAGAELFRVDGQTNSPDDANSSFS